MELEFARVASILNYAPQMLDILHFYPDNFLRVASINKAIEIFQRSFFRAYHDPLIFTPLFILHHMALSNKLSSTQFKFHRAISKSFFIIDSGIRHCTQQHLPSETVFPYIIFAICLFYHPEIKGRTSNFYCSAYFEQSIANIVAPREEKKLYLQTRGNDGLMKTSPPEGEIKNSELVLGF